MPNIIVNGRTDLIGSGANRTLSANCKLNLFKPTYWTSGNLTIGSNAQIINPPQVFMCVCVCFSVVVSKGVFTFLFCLRNTIIYI